ncbi:hypothetical protein AVEN_14395-1 [Araneus ventricosus]|uniref:Uncharacterized protein n=1 Tax=Araneus ventricosus TaxID=182803 RepID=A0A4Y2U6Z9_ARAVE|nr:hypothetical protein AVEN_14395-1 [Araneus ventricosus]
MTEGRNTWHGAPLPELPATSRTVWPLRMVERQRQFTADGLIGSSNLEPSGSKPETASACHRGLSIRRRRESVTEKQGIMSNKQKEVISEKT